MAIFSFSFSFLCPFPAVYIFLKSEKKHEKRGELEEKETRHMVTYMRDTARYFNERWNYYPAFIAIFGTSEGLKSPYFRYPKRL